MLKEITGAFDGARTQDLHITSQTCNPLHHADCTTYEIGMLLWQFTAKRWSNFNICVQWYSQPSLTKTLYFHLTLTLCVTLTLYVTLTLIVTLTLCVTLTLRVTVTLCVTLTLSVTLTSTNTYIAIRIDCRLNLKSNIILRTSFLILKGNWN